MYVAHFTAVLGSSRCELLTRANHIPDAPATHHRHPRFELRPDPLGGLSKARRGTKEFGGYFGKRFGRPVLTVYALSTYVVSRDPIRGG